MSNARRNLLALAAPVLLAACCARIAAEEIWLHDNTRLYGLVRGVTQDGKLNIHLHNGEQKTVPLDEIIAVRFLGRAALLLQSGVQEFRFVQGGKLRGQILENQSDELVVESAFAGRVSFNVSRLKGFVALPMIGFVGRKSEELVDGDRGNNSSSIDLVLDRRGSLYPCVLSKFERTQVFLDYEQSLINKPINLLYLSGVRLADATRAKVTPWDGHTMVRVTSRDGSVLEGDLEKIHMNRWHLRPVWNPETVLPLELDEITLVQTLGGKVQYLSQLDPVDIHEQTRIAPNQPFQMDRDVQGYDLSIAGKRYPWGVGVHADSELTFDLGGRFKVFLCESGVASRMGRRGSVVFTVLGDGKPLFASKVVQGGDSPVRIEAKIEGVQKLTLKVSDASDLDLGDAAIWGAARVTR